MGKILTESKNIPEQTDTTDTVCQMFLAEQKAARVASASGIYVINYVNTSLNSWIVDSGTGAHVCSNVHTLRRVRQFG